MKNLVKLVTINDGNEKEHQDSTGLYTASKPRAERIIAAFLDDGWKIIDLVKQYNPAMQKGGSFNCYLGGIEMLFTKTVEDDAKDNGDELLDSVLHEWTDCRPLIDPDPLDLMFDPDQWIELDADEDNGD